MRILAEGTKTYPDDPARMFRFGRFAERAADFWLCAGQFDFEQLKPLRGQTVVYLDLEEPNRFFTTDPAFSRHDFDDYFAKVFTLCPYTASWLNRRQGNERRSPVCFPFNEQFIPEPREKQFDVIYSGHIVAPSISRLVDALTPFNYRLVSQSDDPRVTDRSASYAQKLDLVARSRVSVMQNLLFLWPKHVQTVRATEGWEENEAFSQVPRSGVVTREDEVMAPQIKSRVFEAALCRSLILCRRDPWNVIERFFEPELEFLYYEPGELAGKLEHVLRNYDAFAPVVERAYARARREYTTEAFFERHLKTLRP